MKLLQVIFVLQVLATIFLDVAFTSTQDQLEEEQDFDVGLDKDVTPMMHEMEEPTLLRGASWFLRRYKPKNQLKCNRFPRICRTKGSSGPDCCKRKCVNVMKDGLNCGMCGNKCRYSQICCGGKCINPSFDSKNCGGCGNKCKHGEFCAYGMCNYA